MKLRSERIKTLSQSLLPLRFAYPVLQIFDDTGRTAGHCEVYAVQYMRPDWVRLYVVRGFIVAVVSLIQVHRLSVCVSSEMSKAGDGRYNSVEVFAPSIRQDTPIVRERDNVAAIRRSMREMLAPGKHTKLQWREAMRRDGWKCLRCGTMKALSKDHIVPLASGGTNDIENLQTLCRKCNSWKGNRTIDFRTHADSLRAGL
jgi:5-methylcytosine-specific restriction endonuclease McrA